MGEGCYILAHAETDLPVSKCLIQDVPTQYSVRSNDFKMHTKAQNSRHNQTGHFWLFSLHLTGSERIQSVNDKYRVNKKENKEINSLDPKIIKRKKKRRQKAGTCLPVSCESVKYLLRCCVCATKDLFIYLPKQFAM